MDREGKHDANQNNTKKNSSSNEEIELFQAYTEAAPGCDGISKHKNSHVNNKHCCMMETAHYDDREIPNISLLEIRNSSHALNESVVGSRNKSTEQPLMDIDSTMQLKDILNSSTDSLAEMLLSSPASKNLEVSLTSFSPVLQQTPTRKKSLNVSRNSITEGEQFSDLLDGLEWSPLPNKANSR